MLIINRRSYALWLLFLITFFIASSTHSNQNQHCYYGDINQDSEINVLDVVLLMRYLLGFEGLEIESLALADVNGDDRVDINDVYYIMRYNLGLIKVFPVCEGDTEDLYFPSEDDYGN